MTALIGRKVLISTNYDPNLQGSIVAEDLLTCTVGFEAPNYGWLVHSEPNTCKFFKHDLKPLKSPLYEPPRFILDEPLRFVD